MYSFDKDPIFIQNISINEIRIDDFTIFNVIIQFFEKYLYCRRKMNLNKLKMIRTTNVFFEFAAKRYVKTKKINLFEKTFNKKKKSFIICNNENFIVWWKTKNIKSIYISCVRRTNSFDAINSNLKRLTK